VRQRVGPQVQLGDSPCRDERDEVVFGGRRDRGGAAWPGDGRRRGRTVAADRLATRCGLRNWVRF